MVSRSMRQRLQFTAPGQFEALLRQCVHRLSVDPADANQWFVLAQGLEGVRRDGQALRLARRAMALLPGQPVLLRFVGALSKRLNRLDEAKDCYGEISRLLPGDEEALAELADIDSRQRILSAPLRVRAEPKGAPSAPISVNLLYKWWDQPWLRQTPGGTGRWGNHQFTANQQGGQSDWVVVYEDLDVPRTVTCRQGNLVLATGEPPSLSRYSRRYLDQFDLVVTSHEDLEHPRVLLSQVPLPWHIGLSGVEAWPGSGPIGYDLLSGVTGLDKAFAVSAIVSDKVLTEGHVVRGEFLRRLKALMGDKLHLYGRGYCEVANKWAAIAPYKFHLCIENYQSSHYWTEKLSDAYLGWSIPIYHGLTKVREAFDPSTFCEIDISDPEATYRRIMDFMERHRDTDVSALLARQRAAVLNGHNMFNRLAEICADATGTAWRQVTIHPEVSFQKGR